MILLWDPKEKSMVITQLSYIQTKMYSSNRKPTNYGHFVHIYIFLESIFHQRYIQNHVKKNGAIKRFTELPYHMTKLSTEQLHNDSISFGQLSPGLVCSQIQPHSVNTATLFIIIRFLAVTPHRI